jgi:hypothetical protein
MSDEKESDDTSTTKNEFVLEDFSEEKFNRLWSPFLGDVPKAKIVEFLNKKKKDTKPEDLYEDDELADTYRHTLNIREARVVAEHVMFFMKKIVEQDISVIVERRFGFGTISAYITRQEGYRNVAVIGDDTNDTLPGEYHELMNSSINTTDVDEKDKARVEFINLNMIPLERKDKERDNPDYNVDLKVDEYVKACMEKKGPTLLCFTMSRVLGRYNKNKSGPSPKKRFSSYRIRAVTKMAGDYVNKKNKKKLTVFRLFHGRACHFYFFIGFKLNNPTKVLEEIREYEETLHEKRFKEYNTNGGKKPDPTEVEFATAVHIKKKKSEEKGNKKDDEKKGGDEKKKKKKKKKKEPEGEKEEKEEKKEEKKKETTEKKKKPKKVAKSNFKTLKSPAPGMLGHT